MSNILLPPDRDIDSGVVYQLYDERFDTAGEYLDALAHEYRTGDSDYVKQKLEDEGYDLADIGQ